MRTLLGVAALVCGAFLTIGCALAILFELQGFGRPRDAEPRLWYVGLLVLAIGACVAVPAALLRRR